jgi:tRNA threonylcarbamoyladenosine biosynthesis protein TsaE
MKIYSSSVEETRAAGSGCAALANPGDVFALQGDLGTGKTEFVRGFVKFFGCDVIVRSPSFSILNIYKTSKFPINHFDFYRLSSSSELRQIGFEEYVSGDGICLLEWGTLFPEILPGYVKTIRFTDEGLNSRSIETTFDF